MPDRCFFCGENAVIKDDVDGGTEQNICIECGAIDPGIKLKPEHKVEEDENQLFCDSSQEKRDNDQICESCGDLLPTQSPSVTMCSECQAMEEEESKNGGTILPGDSGTPSHMSDVKCNSCGSSDVSLDNIGTEERLVCRTCGAVFAGQDFTHDDFEVMTRSYRNSSQTLPKFARRKQKLRGLEAGHEKITFLQNKFCFPDIVKEEAVEMFDRVFYKNMLRGHITTKVHIAAACVFIVSRIHDIPVSITHFIDFVDKFSLFIWGKNFVLKCLDMKLPYLPLTSQIEHCLGRSFSSKILKQVGDILFLWRKAWLSEGRSREGIIVLAAYYAYLNSGKCNKFISFPVFRKKYDLPPTSRTLQVECKDLFLKLVSNIPWVLKKNVKPNTLHLYIDDVLKYQKSLFQLAFKSPTSSLESVLIDKDKVSTPDNPSEGSGRLSLIRKFSDSHKDILLPTSMKKPRRETLVLETKIPEHIDLDCTEVSASEFEDEEISSYLLTDEEQARVKCLKISNMAGRKNHSS